jgi:hypothetical protein
VAGGSGRALFTRAVSDDTGEEAEGGGAGGGGESKGRCEEKDHRGQHEAQPRKAIPLDPLHGLFLETLKASLPTSKYVPWQLLLDGAGPDDPPAEAARRTKHRATLKRAVLDPILGDTEIVDSFVVPLFSWIIDPNWPVCGPALDFVEWLLAERPVLVALALEHILGAVLPGSEQGSSQASACKAVASIGRANGGSGEVEIGMLLVHIHGLPSAEACNDVFASRDELKALVRRAANLEREARGEPGSPRETVIDDWDMWYDENDDPVFINVFGLLSD